ncbi:alpha/beta hydrolase [Amycolatopsis sp. PS_44_ISF1]|uniref:alpha/beta hydrolase n=1 Tax=Amycolatopsis sp. PS_44_ISF1 TaxID=2974917 RepID=UPI0028DFBD60|nr:alpha/beta hydrolase [Amycolatopsis sp. PS_44_ISF1]MDT8914758.1 alpha/beta hydrolase [Amycolatopsis sp. PS_44_ISF1]
MVREEVSFGAAGQRRAAWFYRPETTGTTETAEAVPGVVMAHGFGAVRALGLDRYARRFAAAGFAVLVFDYLGFGDSEGFPRQVLDIDAQLRDWSAAVDDLRGRPGVDPDRVALWGSSFSGGHVVSLAARDARVAAVVSQVPYLGLVRKRALPQPRLVKLVLKALADRVAGARSPVLVPAIGEPGSGALLSMPAAEARFRSLLEPGAQWRNAVAARIILRLPGYRPGTVAGEIACPVLFCACEDDDITPRSLIVAAAGAAPRGRLVTYPGEHFGIYQGEVFERAVRDQTRFLTEHLTRGPRPRP